MKAFLTSAFIFLLFTSSFSQDLILTKKGDSLNCRITEVEENMIHFSLKLSSEEKRIVMSKEQIKYYEFNYYLKPRTNPNGFAQKGDDDYAYYQSKPQQKKWRLALNGGWSYLTAKMDDNLPKELKAYYEELRKGYNFNADAAFFFGKFFGAGISYSLFRSRNSYSPVYIIDSISKKIRSGELRDNISISYLGPTFFFRFSSKAKTFHFMPYLSLGYLGFKNDGMAVDPVKITGNTLGRKTGFAMEYAIEDNLFFGIDASYTSGVITEYTLESGNTKKVIKLNSKEYSNISRIDFSGGIRFLF